MESLNSSIKATISLDKKDVISFMFYTFSKRASFKIILVLLSIFLIFLLLAILVSGGKIFIELATPLLLLLLLIIIMPLILYISGAKEYKSNLRLKEIQNFEFTSSDIYAKGDSFESRLTWDKVYKLTESKNYFYIWQSKNSANIIPKRCLDSTALTFLKDQTKTFRK